MWSRVDDGCDSHFPHRIDDFNACVMPDHPWYRAKKFGSYNILKSDNYVLAHATGEKPTRTMEGKEFWSIWDTVREKRRSVCMGDAKEDEDFPGVYYCRTSEDNDFMYLNWDGRTYTDNKPVTSKVIDCKEGECDSVKNTLKNKEMIKTTRLLANYGDYGCRISHHDPITTKRWTTAKLICDRVDRNKKTYNQFAYGDFHACGLTSDGAIECFGVDASKKYTKSLRWIKGASNGDKFVQLAVGTYHTCGLTSNGVIECFGDNRKGRTNGGKPKVASNNKDKFVQVAVAKYHTCGVTSNGAIECFGENNLGKPKVASNNKDKFVQVAVSTYHTCGVTSNGTIECFGYNREGQTNGGTPKYASNNKDKFVQVAVGTYHTCGLTSNGAIECFGYDRHGQTNGGKPKVASNNKDKIVQVAVGEQHTCGLTSDGAIECFGSNVNGQTNGGTPKVASNGKFVQLDVGEYHTCGVTSDGYMECFQQIQRQQPAFDISLILDEDAHPLPCQGPCDALNVWDASIGMDEIRRHFAFTDTDLDAEKPNAVTHDGIRCFLEYDVPRKGPWLKNDKILEYVTTKLDSEDWVMGNAKGRFEKKLEGAYSRKECFRAGKLAPPLPTPPLLPQRNGKMFYLNPMLCPVAFDENGKVIRQKFCRVDPDKSKLYPEKTGFFGRRKRLVDRGKKGSSLPARLRPRAR